jgi:hypothetical protein
MVRFVREKRKWGNEGENNGGGGAVVVMGECLGSGMVVQSGDVRGYKRKMEGLYGAGEKVKGEREESDLKRVA